MYKASTPIHVGPPYGATSQDEVQDTLDRILAEMAELRIALRKSQRLLTMPPVTLLDNVVNDGRVQRQDSPATGDEPGSQNTGETEREIPRSMILRGSLSTSVLYIGGARDPRRDMVGWSNLEPSGWVNRFIIHVPTVNPAGQHMRRINVGEASEPNHRINMSWCDDDTNGHGWTQRLCFFVWEEPGPGRVMVSAARTPNPTRWKLELGRHVGTRPEDEGWVERITFWVPEW